MIKDCKVCGKHYNLLEKYHNWYAYTFNNFNCKSCGSEYKLKKYNKIYVVLFYIVGGYLLINIFMDYFNIINGAGFLTLIMVQIFTPFILFYEQN